MKVFHKREAKGIVRCILVGSHAIPSHSRQIIVWYASLVLLQTGEHFRHIVVFKLALLWVCYTMSPVAGQIVLLQQQNVQRTTGSPHVFDLFAVVDAKTCTQTDT